MTKEEAIEILDAYRRGREGMDEAVATLYAKGVKPAWIAERSGTSITSLNAMRFRHERGIRRVANLGV